MIHLPAGILVPVLALFGQAPSSQTHSTEAREIVLEVLRYEALRSREWSICLRRTSRGFPFDWPRENGGFGWIKAPARPPQEYTVQRDLGEEEATALDRAAEQVIAAPPSASPPLIVDRSQLPTGLQSADPSCADLTYTVPAIAGDIAFVQTTFSCGPVCAEGWRYALRRRGGRWSLFAVNFIWIS